MYVAVEDYFCRSVVELVNVVRLICQIFVLETDL